MTFFTLQHLQISAAYRWTVSSIKLICIKTKVTSHDVPAKTCAGKCLQTWGQAYQLMSFSASIFSALLVLHQILISKWKKGTFPFHYCLWICSAFFNLSLILSHPLWRPSREIFAGCWYASTYFWCFLVCCWLFAWAACNANVPLKWLRSSLNCHFFQILAVKVRPPTLFQAYYAEEQFLE